MLGFAAGDELLGDKAGARGISTCGTAAVSTLLALDG
jgi:hypothetical protein